MAEDWRQAFVKNELQPVGDLTAAELERQLRADGFVVTVVYVVEDGKGADKGAPAPESGGPERE